MKGGREGGGREERESTLMLSHTKNWPSAGHCDGRL